MMLLKKYGILFLGILLGIGLMYYVQNAFERQMDERSGGATPDGIPISEVDEIDYDAIYKKLKEEQQGKGEKYWFDKRLEKLKQEEAAKKKEIEKEGEEAQNEFLKYLE